MASMEEEARERSRELARYLYYLSIDYAYASFYSKRILFVLKGRQKHLNAVFFCFCNSHALKVLNLLPGYLLFLRPDRVKMIVF